MILKEINISDIQKEEIWSITKKTTHDVLIHRDFPDIYKRNVLPISVFHFPIINSNPQKYLKYVEEGKSWMPEPLSEFFVWYIIGVLSSEQDHISLSEGFWLKNIRRGLKRLNRGEDSGLFHPEISSAWNSLSDEDKDLCESLILKSVESIDLFPKIGKMNIIATNDKTITGFGPINLEAFIPVSVESKNGLSGILFSTVESDEKYFHCSSLVNSVSTGTGINLKDFHVWDLIGKKIRSASGNQLDIFKDRIYQMCTPLSE